MNFKKLAITVAIIMVASLIPFGGTASATSTLVVDDDGHDCPGAIYTSIQAAVNAAASGDTISVCPGTYVEQVTIPNSINGLTISSLGYRDAIIKAPTAMVDPKAIVRVNGATNVTISRFTISGPGDGSCDSIRYGVRVDGAASAIISDNHITMIQDTPFGGCQNGVGILVGRMVETTTGTATISNNLMSTYQKNGITVDNAGSSANISGNTILGAGPTTITAQNGIQISRGATALIQDNSVSGNDYTPASYVACGILYYQAGGVHASHNTLFANERNMCNFGKGGGQYNPIP